jgi:nitrogen regulatory protein PII
MKRIEVIVGLHKLSEVCSALKAIGIDDIATNEADNNVRRKMQSEVSGGGDAHAGRSETRLEIVVSAEGAAEVIRAFAGPGWRDLLGDGKIVVYEIGDSVRVRASESRENAR